MATESDEASSSAPPGGLSAGGEGEGPGKPVNSPRGGTKRRRPADPGRRALVLAPIVAVVVGLVVVFATLPDGTPVPASGGSSSAGSSPSGVTERLGYFVTIDELRQRGARAAAGEEPYKLAVADLMTWAKGAVNEQSHPVQPLVVVGTSNPFVDDAARAYGLGLAYGISGDEQYATASRQTIRAWVDTAISTGDTCPDSGGCHTSLIIGRAGAGFAFGADLIDGSAAWTDADRADLQAWMRNVLLPAVSHRPNNWGDAGTFLRVVAADYAGDTAEFDLAIEKWRSIADLIEADGRIPEEVRRGSAGISYTQEALQYKIGVARIAERHGIDLWDYVGAKGGSLRKAMDRLADYWHRPQDWPDYKDPRVPSTGPVWEIAYAHWQDPRWVGILLDGRPYGDSGHSAIRWTTLTNGVPIDPLVAGGPSASPGASSRPTASPSSAASSGSPQAIADLAVELGSPLVDPVRIRISWDKPSTPNAGVDLERSVGGGQWSKFAIASDGRSASDSLRPGANHAYRVRAAVAGAAGPWTTLTDVSVARLEASDTTFVRQGTWKAVSFREYSAGSAFSTDAKAATLTWQGMTQAIAIIGPTGPTRGRMIITVDGGRAKVVDLQSSHFKARTVLFTASWSGPGVHELVIESQPRNGRPTVAVDDIVTLTSSLTAPLGS